MQGTTITRVIIITLLGFLMATGGPPTLLHAADEPMPAIRIEGTLTTTGSPMVNLSGAPFSVTIDSNNQMLVSMGGPFGMTIAQLLLSKGRFVLVNYMMQEVWEGNPDASELKAQMHLPVKPTELLSLFRGRIPGDTARFSTPSTRADGALLYRSVSTTASDHVEFALIDPTTRLLRQYQVKASNGDLVLDVTVSDYQRVGTVLIPHKIAMATKQKKESATMTITDAEPLGDSAEPLELEIPSSYSRRMFQ